MSAATKAKSALGRATIAIRMLKTQKKLWRAFDDCCEMGDGDDVVREIRLRSLNDPELVRALKIHGYDYWLKTNYFPNESPPPTQDIFTFP